MLRAIGGFIMLIITAVIILSILSTYIRVVPQVQALVVEGLGAYLGIYSMGIHFPVPLIDRVAKKVNLKEQVEDFPPQSVITKDNAAMQIDTVVLFCIASPRLYTYDVGRPLLAVENLTATTLRNITGDLELDGTSTPRETINTKMQESLDIATDPWDIKVTRVKFENIIPPAATQEAMEKQMKAKRERRESILRAEDEKKFMVLVTEGHKEPAVLNAKGERGTAILAAETEKEKKIREAEDQTGTIRSVQKATAGGIRFIKEAGAGDAVLQLKGLEVFQAAVNGKANKTIIPSDIQRIADLVKSIVEVAPKDEAVE